MQQIRERFAIKAVRTLGISIPIGNEKIMIKDYSSQGRLENSEAPEQKRQMRPPANEASRKFSVFRN